MKSNLLLAKTTLGALENFLDNPAQFLIIAGQSGSGKTALALELGRELLDIEISVDHPNVLRVAVPPKKTEISIDQVRELLGKLKLTTTGTGTIRRLVLVENGQLMSEEAQNSLLKMLEEPPADTQIIMTVNSAGSILPTITSRGQTLEVNPVELTAAKNYFADKYSESDVEKAWMLADGLAGLTRALLDNSTEHELKTAVTEAKNFLSSNKYQRLTKTNNFTKNRQQLELLIEGLRKVVKTAQHQSLKQGKPANQARITAARKKLDELSEALQANVSAKTVYLKLCLNLGI